MEAKDAGPVDQKGVSMTRCFTVGKLYNPGFGESYAHTGGSKVELTYKRQGLPHETVGDR